MLAFERTSGRDEDLSVFLPGDLAAGQLLTAKHQGKAFDNWTLPLYETRLIHLEEFALGQGDNAVLFGEG